MALLYRPDIDGLRAVAIVPVICFHLDCSFLPGGHLGVDVFFVISGFLITRLLVGEIEAGRVSLVDFWRRRVLRIIPALLVMVLVTLLVGQGLLYAPERYELSVNSTAALVSLANLSHWLIYGPYWGASAESSPLLHTWSLGVEEQFYLFYPFVLVMALRGGMRKGIVLLGGISVISLAAFLYGTWDESVATFYLLPTRAWELGAGAITALLLTGRGLGRVPGSVVVLGGLALVMASYVGAPANGLSAWSLAAVTGAVLVIWGGGVTRGSRVAFVGREDLCGNWEAVVLAVFVALASYRLCEGVGGEIRSSG